MKNFPHQFNDLKKLFDALQVAKSLIDENKPLNDENFGEMLVRRNIYTYRDRTLTIDDFLAAEKNKPLSNQGHLTVARDIRRLFYLLGFLQVSPDTKKSDITPLGIQLLETVLPESRNTIWKESLLQAELDDSNGNISHPYRILLQLVDTIPGIETAKLMLVLEAKDDSEIEFDRIKTLAILSVQEIITKTGTTESMAKNAVKILPGIAEQLGDIQRKNNKSYALRKIIVFEDGIIAETTMNGKRKAILPFRETSAKEIAKIPNINDITSSNIDLTEAIQTRQKRFDEHQRIVQFLAKVNEKSGYALFEGLFDCLAVKDDQSLLYEVKTILDSIPDQERQTVKAVGQLKFYKFKYSKFESTIPRTKIKEILVFSRRPNKTLIEFCEVEKVSVIWFEDEKHFVAIRDGKEEEFEPDNIT